MNSTVAKRLVIGAVLVAEIALLFGLTYAGSQQPTDSVFVGERDVAIQVRDQAAFGAVTVPRVVSPVDGWVVLRAERDGAPAEVIGAAPVRKGTNENVPVVVNPTSTLPDAAYAIVVTDRAALGAFEYTSGDSGDFVTLGPAASGMGMGGAKSDAPAMTRSMDWPLVANGAIVAKRFSLSPFNIVYRLSEANIVGSFLDADGTAAVISGIIAPKDSWVVVIRVGRDAGDQNEVLGAAQVPAGTTESLSIPLKDFEDGHEVSALLVADLGTPGVLEVDPQNPSRSVDAPYLVRSWFVWKRVIAGHE